MNHFELHAAKQRAKNIIFQAAALVGLLFALFVLLLLLFTVVKDGAARVNWQFLTSFPSRHADQAGIIPGLIGSFYMVLLTAAFAVPVGIGAAIYLEEYGRK